MHSNCGHRSNNTNWSMIMRIVKICINDLTERVDNTGENIFSAIGYLSQWALQTYPDVEIHSDGNIDMVAYYYKQDTDGNRVNPPGYVIGAVWHDGHFGFHS